MADRVGEGRAGWLTTLTSKLANHPHMITSIVLVTARTDAGWAALSLRQTPTKTRCASPCRLGLQRAKPYGLARCIRNWTESPGA